MLDSSTAARASSVAGQFDCYRGSTRQRALNGAPAVMFIHETLRSRKLEARAAFLCREKGKEDFLANISGVGTGGSVFPIRLAPGP